MRPNTPEAIHHDTINAQQMGIGFGGKFMTREEWGNREGWSEYVQFQKNVEAGLRGRVFGKIGR